MRRRDMCYQSGQERGEYTASLCGRLYRLLTTNREEVTCPICEQILDADPILSPEEMRHEC